MTDPTPPLSDEDLSAVLDGEAGPDVVARVQADPQARARLDALRAVSGAIRHHEVAPLAPATVDDLIGRALAVADEPAPEAPTAPPAAAWPPPSGPSDTVVTPLAPPRGTRNAPRFLVAAAIIALVAIGLGLVWSGTRSDTDTTAQDTSGEELGRADDGGGGGDGAEAPASEGDEVEEETSALEPNAAVPDTTEAGGSADEVPTIADLGTFADDDELRSALAAGFPAGSPTDFDDALAQDAIERCDVQARHVFEIDDEPTDVGQAVVDGDEVLVLAYEGTSFDDPGTPAVITTALDPDTCNPRFTFERPVG